MKEKHDIAAGRLSHAQLADNFADLHPRYTPLQAAVESSRCLFCHDAPCVEACPTGIDIPGFIRKISTGNTRGAAVTILSENIMGATCANACPVEELCEQVCVKVAAEGKPVKIGRLQRYATDHLFDTGQQPFTRAAPTGHRIAVVGAGPAGLACAHRLAMLGHTVTVFDSREKPGGLNEFGLAYYKMLDERAAREAAFILDIGGIELKQDACLGKDFSLQDLRDSYDAVFLGLGHNAVNSLGLDHEEAEGVLDAVRFIERIRQEELADIAVGRRIVVIGGGNTAIDIAVQTKKLGAETVTMVYRRGPGQMGATDFEQEVAETNGVLIRTWAQPLEIHAQNGGVTGVTFEYTRAGRGGRPEGTGETFHLEADMVFKAIGQNFDAAAAGLANQASPAVERGRIVVDENRRTSLDGVYAGGDCVPGRDLTVVAVQDGKLAAHAIHAFLLEQKNG